jgi:UPF0755 protein
MRLIQNGPNHFRKITLPEGWTVKQALALISQTQGLEGEIASMPPEGSLLPQTYCYKYGHSAQSLIITMQKDAQKRLDDLWRNRSLDSAELKTPQEALILASIVEKESSDPNEMPKIAAVFLNRLKKKMRLQSDVTVMYGILDGWVGQAPKAKEIRIQNPYNTYYIPRLPPTPICNPGLDALKATLHPQMHDYFYFLNDEKMHFFAKTYEEHRSNIAKYLKKNTSSR